MALFQHLVDFKRAALARLSDQRRATRYAVAPDFPLKASVSLIEAGLMGQRNPEQIAPGKRRSWGGAVLDLSRSGLRLQLPPAAVTLRGELTIAALSLDGLEIRIPAKVAHFSSRAGTAICGLELKMTEVAELETYEQLLKAVALSSLLVPVKKTPAYRHPRDFKAQQYVSNRKTRLTTWRDGGARLDSFELVLGEYCLRGEMKHPTLEIFRRKGDKTKTAWSAPSYGLSSGVENEELRKLYRLIALNLPKAVPADARELLRLFANARNDWKPPPLKRS